MNEQSEYHKQQLTKYTKLFYRRVTQYHSNRYDLHKTVYTGMNNYVIATCKIHGDFKIKARSLSIGCNCPKCASIGQSKKLKSDPNRIKWLNENSQKQKLTTEDFIQRSNKLHNGKYDYNKTKYINGISKVVITCPRHGDFQQIAKHHMYENGCPKCGNNYSIKENLWLDQYEITNRQYQIYYNNKKNYYLVDGYNKHTNTVYEFFGDYWHGNINKYPKDFINKKNKKSMQALYEETLSRITHLKELGFNVIYIWELDYVPTALP